MEIKDVIHLYLNQEFLYKAPGSEWSSPMKFTADQLFVYYQLADDPKCEFDFKNF